VPAHLETSEGDLEVLWARETLVDHLAERWPLPIATLLPREEAASPENRGATFVIPFAYEGQHVNVVYLPQLPQSRPAAEERFERTRDLMGEVVRAVWASGYGGLFLPLSTLRRQGEVGVAGLGAVIGPEPEEREDAPNPVEILLGVLKAATEAGFPFEASSRAKFVSSAVAGEVALDYGLCDGLPPICFRERLDPRDPALSGLAAAGATSILHFPVPSTRFPECSAPIQLEDPVLNDPARGLGGEVSKDGSAALNDPSLKAGPGEAPQHGRASLETGPQEAGRPRRDHLEISVEHSEERSKISSNGARRIFRVLCLVAACDGSVDPSEREILDDFVLRFGIRPEEAALLEAEGSAAKRLSVGKNPLERELMFQLMVDVAAADGALHKNEEKRLVTFADTLGISRAELRRRLGERLGPAVDPSAPASTEAGGRATDSQFGVTASGTLRASAKGLRRIYRVLWYLANSEGDVGPEEDALLDGYRKRYGISPLEAAQLRREGMRGKGIEISKSPEERALLLEELVAVAAADGELSPPERKRLEKLGRLLKVPPAELERLLREQLSVSPEEAFEARESGEGEWALAGKLVVLGVPEGLMGLNLVRVPVDSTFRGFHSVPPGVHRLAVMGSQADAVRWIKLEPGEVQVLEFDGRALVEPSQAKGAGAREQAEAGRLDAALRPFAFQHDWRDLTEPLAYAPFPPPTFPVPVTPEGSRLELACQDHGGKGSGLLAELAFTFLRGVLDDDATSLQRYHHLVQAMYHCGQRIPREDPVTFEWVPHLLMAQQRQLPSEAFARDSPLVLGSHYLSEDLIDADHDDLVESGRRWAVFVAGHHPGAPEAHTVPASFRDVSIPEEFQAGLTEATDEIRSIEYAQGRDCDLLLPHLSYVSRIREASQDWLGACAAQSRLVEVGEQNDVPPGKLAQGYGRLARLQRECGRAHAAAAAEARSRELALQAVAR
jgi:tellurite resistance protein